MSGYSTAISHMPSSTASSNVAINVSDVNFLGSSSAPASSSSTALYSVSQTSVSTTTAAANAPHYYPPSWNEPKLWSHRSACMMFCSNGIPLSAFLMLIDVLCSASVYHDLLYHHYTNTRFLEISRWRPRKITNEKCFSLDLTSGSCPDHCTHSTGTWNYVTKTLKRTLQDKKKSDRLSFKESETNAGHWIGSGAPKDSDIDETTSQSIAGDGFRERSSFGSAHRT